MAEFGFVSTLPEQSTCNPSAQSRIVAQLLEFGHFASYTPDGPLEIIVTRARPGRLGTRLYVEQVLLDRTGLVRSVHRIRAQRSPSLKFEFF